MLNLVISASLCFLGVRAGGGYFVVKEGRCDDEGGEYILDEAECQKAVKALGYKGFFFPNGHGADDPPGCSGVASLSYAFHNPTPNGFDCGHVFKDDYTYDCLCARSNAGGAGEGPGDDGGDAAEDKVCIDVRKRRACKELEYCNFERKASPMCTDKNPGVKIPIKEFCEVIHVRGWCKRVSGCFWTGEKCMLKSEAACTDVAKRRICTPFRAKNGGCLNGKNCFWTGRNCLESDTC